MGRIDIIRPAKKVIERLCSNHYDACVVGGCVRDSVLGIEPKDWDICTSAKPEDVKSLFERHGHTVIETGMKHGTVTVRCGGMNIEVTTFRADGDYSDNRHPDRVVFVETLEEDLARRDFTINAMAANYYGAISDPYGGMDDLKAGIIRCVGNPDERFQEDALRMLRAIRFAVRFNFKIEEQTRLAIKRNKSLIKNISKERICAEIIKTLSCEIKDEANVYLLMEVLGEVLMINIDACPFVPTNIMGSHSLEFKLACLLFACNGTHIDILKELKFSNNVIKAVDDIVGGTSWLYNQIADEHIGVACDWKTYVARKMLGKYGAISTDIVRYFISMNTFINRHRMRGIGEDILVRIYFSEGIDCYNISKLQVNGNDMMSLGFKGKQIGKVMRLLLDNVMADRNNNDHDELMEAAKDMVDDAKRQV